MKKYWEDYYQKNRDKISIQTKQYRENNKEKEVKRHRKYRKSGKGKACIQRGHITRRIKEKEIINTLTSDEWLDILKEYDYRCVYCGCNFDENTLPTRDHIIPISKGGNNTKENIVPACQSCNSKKNNKINIEFVIK